MSSPLTPSPCVDVDPLVAEVIEALRAARELCAYISHNVEDDDGRNQPNLLIGASSVRHAEQISALLCDLQERADRVLGWLEADADSVELPHSAG